MRKLAAVLVALLMALAGTEVAPPVASAAAPAKASAAKRRARKRRATKRRSTKRRSRAKRRRVRVCRKVRRRRRCRYVYVAAASASRPATPAPAVTYPNKPEAPGAPGGYNTFSGASTAWIDQNLHGTGVYLCNELAGIPGPSCSGGLARSADDILNHADTMGARQIWVRCGDSRRGFPASAKAALQGFVNVAHGRGKVVVCWDVPNFWNIQEDARRLAEMGTVADAVASDLESGSDSISSLPWANNPYGGGYAGPQLQTDKGVRWSIAYGGWVRYFLGQYGRSALDYPLIVVTMQPQTHASYPFVALGQTFQVISPMLYRGVCRPADFVAAGIAFLRGLAGLDFGSRHRILITGMAYNSGNSANQCENIRSSDAQIRSDVAQAHAGGAIGASWFVFHDILRNGWQGAVASW